MEASRGDEDDVFTDAHVLTPSHVPTFMIARLSRASAAKAVLNTDSTLRVFPYTFTTSTCHVMDEFKEEEIESILYIGREVSGQLGVI